MTEILYTIQISPESYQTLDTLRKLGLTNSYNKELKRLQQRVADQSLDCRDAFRSKVPIDTGNLRNNGIDVRDASNRLSSEIIVQDYTYTNSRGFQVSAAKLAFELDSGKFSTFKRSQNSFNIGKYSSVGQGTPVGGWINSAISAFNSSRRGVRSGG